MVMVRRVPPLMLVGEGAVQFARERGVRIVDAPDSEEMVAPRAREEWRVWRERCSRLNDDDDSRGPLQGEEKELEEVEPEPLRVRQDTVGAVVLVGDVEQKLEVAAGVSRCVMSSSFPSLFFFLDTSLCARYTFLRREQRGYTAQALWTRRRGQSVQMSLFSRISGCTLYY